MVQEDCPYCTFGCARCKWTGVRPPTEEEELEALEVARDIILDHSIGTSRKTKPTLH